MKIFIVDDASFLCERLGAALSEIVGVELVGTAGTVAAALAALASVQPDLLILDICLPDGTGFDILNHLRETAPQVGGIMIFRRGLSSVPRTGDQGRRARLLRQEP